MVVEQDLLNDKWIPINDRYVKLGVTLVRIGNEWECHYDIGTRHLWTLSWEYSTLEELYDHIIRTVITIFDPKYDYLQSLSVKQKRTLKNWIL